MSINIRTRFPPSPTGDLHIGGVRTALFAYLFAKHHGGEFLLRIEDTDRARSTQASLDNILQGMAWLGLESDGEIIYQSRRTARYRQIIDRLLETGHAYYCRCSRERLEKLRAEQMASKQKPRYDGHCRERGHPPQDGSTIRFKNPRQGEVAFDDMVLGRITIANAELDDLIIARADGSPTYHLTMVVDDMDTAISHVIRGMDHVNNTPRQINLLCALQAPVPRYGHVPMIHDRDGKKLSKRRQAVDVLAYRHQGYLPQALLNYLVRLGWSHGDQEVFSRQEMIALFDGTHLSKSPAVFDQDKLNWLNRHYIQSLPAHEVEAALREQYQALQIDCAAEPTLREVIAVHAQRAETLRQLAAESRYCYREPASYDEKAAAKFFNADTTVMLRHVHDALARLDVWRADTIAPIIKATTEKYGLKFPQVAQPLRLAVTGGVVSPSVDRVLALLSKEKTLERLRRAIDFCGGET